MKKILVIIDRKFLWAILFIVTLFNVSCSSTTEPYSHYWVGDGNESAQKKMASSIKGRQSALGWVILPSLNAKKNKDIDSYAKKYKLIEINYVENAGLLRILKPKKYDLYYDVKSISKLQKETDKVFSINILQTLSNSLYLAGDEFVDYLKRGTILSTIQISCNSPEIKLIEQMWWNGSWFRGIRYKWEDNNIKIQEVFTEVQFFGDNKWITEFNILLCDVVTNKNQIKAATWRKNDAKRKIKLEKEKRKARLKEEKRRAKIQQEKERKAKKAKDDRRKRDLDKASQTCLDLGFKKGTKKYKDCIIELL